MPQNEICFIPHHWAIEDLARSACHDGSHPHIQRAEAGELEELGIAEWLRFPRHLQAGVMRQKRAVGLRGLSCRVGAPLAVASQRKENWAEAMLAQIRCRREAPSNNSITTLSTGEG